jgi:dihydrofolate reductase
MSRVTCNLSISADGYSAGHNQTEKRPFGGDGGDGWGDRLPAWMFDNPEENRTEVDQMRDARAYVMGRNMFGPVRGEWDRQWKGWWGDDPPFHAPVFVITHHPRPAADGRRHHVLLRHRPTSSPTESSRHWPRRARRPGTAMSRSMAARAPSTSISPPA